MSRSSARRLAGFNYGFRPASYFKNVSPEKLVTASILGEQRRQSVVDYLKSGDWGMFGDADWLTEGKLDEDIRTVIGKVHPRFMGGEYLPALGEDEIEIARIALQSVTADVISIRARRHAGGIRYRIVDEYAHPLVLQRDSSRWPLSMGELIDLIEGCRCKGDEQAGCPVFGTLAYNFEPCTLDSDQVVAEMRRFVTLSSVFYPELGAYYEHAIDKYIDSRRPSDD